MHASSRGSASSASVAAGARGASLWSCLHALQPTFSLSTSNTLTPSPKPSVMSYSFVVVPPPVPAATPRYESHITSLLTHVPHPTFMTCTSYSPYFTSSEAAEHALHPEDFSEGDVSSAKQALAYLNRKLPDGAGLVLTITGTRATTSSAIREDKDVKKHITQSNNGDVAASTLTGASSDGIRAVLHDFTHRRISFTEAAAAPQRYRSAGLMVLRGDDGGYTRRRIAEGDTCTSISSSSPPTLPNPYSTFADGAALLRFVSSEKAAASNADVMRDLCLFTGGYAQGHVLDRVWDTPASQSDEENVEGEDCEDHTDKRRTTLFRQTASSLQFLERLEKVYADTEAQLRHAQGPLHAPRLASVESCRETTNAILTRLDAVRQLWLTPSRYSVKRRAASARQLIEDKVLLKGVEEGQRGGGGARVVVTQMLTSAQEFTDYAKDVQRALQLAVGQNLPSKKSNDDALVSPDESLVLIPGLMAPLRAEQFVRATLQLKVIPSAPLQAALHTYEKALRSAQAQLVSPSSALPTSANVGGSNEDNSNSFYSVHMYQQIKEAAEVGFQHAMEDFSVKLAGDLYAVGYTHVNFSAFQYGCGEALGRVVARLPH